MYVIILIVVIVISNHSKTNKDNSNNNYYYHYCNRRPPCRGSADAPHGRSTRPPINIIIITIIIRSSNITSISSCIINV